MCLTTPQSLHISTENSLFSSAMRAAETLISSMNLGYMGLSSMMELSPLFFLRYWEMAASVTPNFLATSACVIPCV